MATRSQKIKVGIFLVTCLALLVGVLVISIGWNNNPMQTFHVKFTETVHIGPGSSVRYLGVTIGQVTRIRITPYNEILATIEIDPARVQLYEGVQANIQSVSIAGGQFIDLQGGDPYGTPLTEGSVILADPSMMAQMRTSVPGILGEMQQSLEHINEVLSQFGTNTVQQIVADVRTLMSDTDAALLEFRDLMKATKGLMTSNQSNVEQILTEMIKTTETLNHKISLLDIESAQNAMVETLDSSDSVGDNMPGIRRDLEMTSQNLNQTLNSLRQTSDSIRRLVDYLERDPSALIQGRRSPSDNNP
jgi:ABC-type transporter Mla subunit MlaD